MQRGLGSGVIVSQDGYILTNNHVVDNATKIQVELSDARVVSEAGRHGCAERSRGAEDRREGSAGRAARRLGRVRVGDVVLAVGNPLGVGQTVTMGIVSAKGRATGLGDGGYEDFLQTDAPINSRQFRRRAREHRGRAGRDQLADPVAVGRQHRHRLRDSVEHGEERDGSAREQRARASRTARRHGPGHDRRSRGEPRPRTRRKARS